ncbi:MAG: multicopper oxidase domain-containing protein [Pedobacter sp.]|jgi:FtsP/CotA-like multicopper oxidase with cupredoxin domain|uniref:multicopper oxidase domain-containing protein n=1 Tax=Pedobacter sp. TaxID=1411316 RepID=UPI00356B2182
MKKLILLLFLTFAYVSGYTQTKSIYACPMHPEVKDDKPSKCPKCGMKLVEVKSKPTKTNQAPVPIQKPLQVSQSKVASKTVRYDLYVRDTTVNFTGKPKRAIAVNGQIPMPTLTFTEGDTAEIYVHNELNEETSLHWHGLFVPNKYDGVPNLTQMPIQPHTTHLYKFPIIQSGTHWYHSHTGLQEQSGMYGSMILNKRAEPIIPTIPVILSEWADMNPKEIDRSLHNATDWFAIKKGSTQSYAEAIREGHFKTKITNEWKRMNAMDVSDVYYDQFLINGKNQFLAENFKAGDKVRLRISNAGASSYFWLNYAGGKITVVANDGNDVVPVEVDRLMIAVSETYDVIVTIPKNMSYEFLVTPEDRTKSASLWLGNGMKMPAQKLPRLNYFEGMKMMNDMMEMNGDLKEMKGMKMQNQIMDMNMVMYPEMSGDDDAKMDHDMGVMDMDTQKEDIVTLNYTMLRAPKNTVLPKGPIKELKFDLTGNMNRYVWTLDNKTVSESDKILIKKGENVRVILYNNSMMRHPMHLHGHDFRLVGKQGDFAPLKNVLDIMPMERDTIEFAATESGDWFFHCHILYHMMSGMGRVFSYENSPANPEIPNPKLAQRRLFADDRMFHFMAENDFASNGNDGMAMLANTRWSIGTEWRLGYSKMHGFETETHIGRYIGKMQWLMPFVGFDWRYRKMGMDDQENNVFGQANTKDNRAVVSIGAEYTLPMLIKAQAEVYNDGVVRLQLMREDIPISKRLRMSFMLNTDKEYMGGFKYIATKYFSLTTHYDSDMGIGAGFSLNY